VKRDQPLEVKLDIEPLISPERWAAAQDILTARKGNWTKTLLKTEQRFLVSGIARCSCRNPLYQHGENRKRRGYCDYYYCAGRKWKSDAPKGADCNVRTILRDLLDATVEHMVTKYLLDVKVFRKILEAAMAKADMPDTSAEKLQREVERLEAKRKRLVDVAVDGLLTKEDFAQRLQTLDREIREVRALLPGKRSAEWDVWRVAAHIAAAFAEFRFLSFVDKRNLLRRAVKEIVVKDSALIALTISGVFLADHTNTGERTAPVADPLDIRESGIEGTRKYVGPSSPTNRDPDAIQTIGGRPKGSGKNGDTHGDKSAKPRPPAML
jgi:hypothetical protein